MYHLILPETSTYNLFDDQKLPKITTRFRICQNLRVDLLRLLTVEIQFEHSNQLKATKTAKNANHSPKKKNFNAEQLHHALEDELGRNEIPPPSLGQVAERMGSFVKTLRTHCPKLCRKIEVRYRKYHNIQLIDVQHVLEQAIANQDDLPPTVSQIAQQFGFQPTIVGGRFPALSRQLTERHHHAKVIYLDSIRQALERAIETTVYPPLTLQEIAQQQGCSKTTLHRHFPELCQALTAKRYVPIPPEDLRQILKQYLDPIDPPPVPFAEVARQLKLPAGIISRLCPNESKAISAQYLTYQADTNQQRKQRLADEARQATFQLYAEGIYPSAVRVMERLSKPGNMKMSEVFNAWKQAISELNLPSSKAQDDLTKPL